MLSYLINSKMLLDDVFVLPVLIKGFTMLYAILVRVIFTLIDLPLPIALKFTPAQFVHSGFNLLQCHLPPFLKFSSDPAIFLLDYC